MIVFIITVGIKRRTPTPKQTYSPTAYRSPTLPSARMPVIDLRSADEQVMERQAGSALSGEDEETAQRLAQLSKISNSQYSSDKAAYEKTVAEFKSIGEKLCANGGDAHMKRVAYRVQALGGRVRDCEMYWDGICGWMA